MDLFITMGPEICSSILAQTRPQTLHRGASGRTDGWYPGGVKYRAPYGANNDANDASAVGESLTEEVMYRENYLQSCLTVRKKI